jgi:hypothetical protein
MIQKERVECVLKPPVSLAVFSLLLSLPGTEGGYSEPGTEDHCVLYVLC